MGCGYFKLNNPKRKRRISDKVVISPGLFMKKNFGKIQNYYKEIKVLGSGAFADVKLYQHLPTSSFRAIKTIYKVGLHQQQLDETYMLKEICVLTSLDHPNILRCYEIFEDSWKYYISMEYCDGGELFKKIVEMKTFSEKDAGEIMHQVLSAMSYCHSKNIIHRDLKPENILLEKDSSQFSVKIADFGSSCFLDKNKRLSGCFGSAYYVAPEVLLDDYNEKCDIWSCGVILFILLTGKAPYSGKDAKMILHLIKTAPLQIDREQVPNVSDLCLDLLQKMLQVDPKQRISAKEAVNHSWILSTRRQKTLKTQPNPENLENLENLENPENPEKLENPENFENYDFCEVLKSLQQFHASVKLKDAVHVFLASQVISQVESQQLARHFRSIDKNSDGKLSKDELFSNYREVMNEENAKETVNKIMSQVDVNLSGDIDYAEFLSACMDHKKYLSIEYLNAAFRLFDRDGSGFITADEIMEVLGTGNDLPGRAWEEIIKDVDENGDGVIDLKEFVGLMVGCN
jgi:calcium-dependent protein kinase